MTERKFTRDEHTGANPTIEIVKDEE